MDNKYIALAVTLAVGIILAGSVLMPVLDYAKVNTGEPLTVDNPYSPQYAPNYTIWNGEDITIKWNETDGYLVNDSPMEISHIQRIMIASNAFCSRTGGTEQRAILNSQYIDTILQYDVSPFVFTISDGAYDLKIYAGSTEQSFTGELEWLVYADPTGNSGLVQPANPNVFYTSNSNKLIVLGNIYTTGENDTFYSYYDGELSVNPIYEDVSGVNISKSLVDGTTDIYKTSISVNVGEETFTPYFVLVDKEIHGHKEWHTTTNLYATIPVMVLVVLLLFAVQAIRMRND